ncbi:hypothetical protein J3F83DRAFT_31928 [Trichoderma novae-zelandiae]
MELEKMEARRHSLPGFARFLRAVLRAKTTVPNRHSLLCEKAQTSSPGLTPGNTLLLKVVLSLALTCLASSVRNAGTGRPWSSWLMISSWAFMLVLSGACRLRKISPPATPCGKKGVAPVKSQLAYLQGELLDRHIFHGNGKQKTLRAKTRRVRFALCVARCEFDESHQHCSGTSDGWLFESCRGKATDR